MLTRLFTFLLLVTLFFPGSVFGAVAHRCQPTDSMSRTSCCQGMSSKLPAQDPFEQLSHRCDIDLRASGQQLATTGYKNLIDDAQSADAVLSAAGSLHLTESSRKLSSIGLHLYHSATRPPAFLRNCSFLI